YDVSGDPRNRSFTYTRKRTGEEVEYTSSGPSFDLRVSGQSMVLFLALIGFSLTRKELTLASRVQAHRTKSQRHIAHLVARAFDGFELTYNLTEPINHSYIVNNIVISNCSEYMHLDN